MAGIPGRSFGLREERLEVLFLHCEEKDNQISFEKNDMYFGVNSTSAILVPLMHMTARKVEVNNHMPVLSKESVADYDHLLCSSSRIVEHKMDEEEAKQEEETEKQTTSEPFRLPRQRILLQADESAEDAEKEPLKGQETPAEEKVSVFDTAGKLALVSVPKVTAIKADKTTSKAFKRPIKVIGTGAAFPRYQYFFDMPPWTRTAINNLHRRIERPTREGSVPSNIDLTN